MKNYKKVYAVRHIESGKIMSRYTKNGFYSRRGDAENRVIDENRYLERRGKVPEYELVESEIVWRKAE